MTKVNIMERQATTTVAKPHAAKAGVWAIYDCSDYRTYGPSFLRHCKRDEVDYYRAFWKYSVRYEEPT